MVVPTPNMNVRRAMILIVIEFDLDTSQLGHYGHVSSPWDQLLL
jgi:hypothetical protein